MTERVQNPTKNLNSMQRTILATTYPKDNPDLALKDKVERL